jgi:hypothetical protein
MSLQCTWGSHVTKHANSNGVGPAAALPAAGAERGSEDALLSISLSTNKGDAVFPSHAV